MKGNQATEKSCRQDEELKDKKRETGTNTKKNYNTIQAY